MKKMLILLATVALAAGTATAQTPSATPGTENGRMQPATPEQQADRLTKQLGLSANQRTQIVTMEQNRREETQALRSQMQTSGNQGAGHQSRQAMRDKYDTQLKGILTADQYTKYSQMRKDHLEKRGGRKTRTKAAS